MLTLAVVLAHFICCSLQVPSFGQTYTATYQLSYPATPLDIVQYTTEYFDYSNGKDRTDTIDLEMKMNYTYITDYTDQLQYQIDFKSKKCWTSAYTTPIQEFAWPWDSWYVGTSTINGIQCDSWETYNGFFQPTAVYSASSDSPVVPVLEYYYQEFDFDGGIVNYTSFTYNVNSSVFDIPSFCN